MAGERLKRVASYLKGEEVFCFIYGDGIDDMNIAETIGFR